MAKRRVGRPRKHRGGGIRHHKHHHRGRRGGSVSLPGYGLVHPGGGMRMHHRLRHHGGAIRSGRLASGGQGHQRGGGLMTSDPNDRGAQILNAAQNIWSQF